MAMRRFANVAGIATRKPLATHQLRKSFARRVGTSNSNATGASFMNVKAFEAIPDLKEHA